MFKYQTESPLTSRIQYLGSRISILTMKKRTIFHQLNVAGFRSLKKTELDTRYWILDGRCW